MQTMSDTKSLLGAYLIMIAFNMSAGVVTYSLAGGNMSADTALFYYWQFFSDLLLIGGYALAIVTLKKKIKVYVVLAKGAQIIGTLVLVVVFFISKSFVPLNIKLTMRILANTAALMSQNIEGRAKKVVATDGKTKDTKKLDRNATKSDALQIEGSAKVDV